MVCLGSCQPGRRERGSASFSKALDYFRIDFIESKLSEERRFGQGVRESGGGESREKGVPSLVESY